MLVRHLPSLSLATCQAWLDDVSESSEWQDSLVYLRGKDGEGISKVNQLQRAAAILPRQSAKRIYCEFESYLSNTTLSLFSLWKIEPEISWEGTQLIRYSQGGFFVPHRDSSDLYPERIITVIAYINQNFSGGETLFPGMDAKIIPQQGLVVSFPSDLIHEAKTVTSGEKYVFVTWAAKQCISWI